MAGATRLTAHRRGYRVLPRLVFVVAVLAFMAGAWVARPFGASGADNGVVGVASTTGQLRVESSGTWRELALPVDATTNLDARLAVATSAMSEGRGQTITVVARRTSGVGEYRVRARLTSDMRVELTIARLVRGHRTVLARSYHLPGLVAKPGDRLALRIHVGGRDQTTISVKAWPGTSAEPARWTLVGRDTTTALARPGWSGVRFGVSSTMTNVPVQFSYDSVRAVGDALVTEPTPSPQPSATPSQPTPSPSATVAPAPTVAPTATAAPTASPTATAAPTASPTPTPTPELPAAAVYVSPSGSDTGPGTAEAPWRTLQKAADTAPAGTTVVVRDGTYAPFTMRRSGTAADPIAFVPYPGERPVVDGRGLVAYTIRLVGVRHVSISGLTVQGGFAERQHGGGIMVESSAHVVIRNNLLRDNHSFGVRAYGSTYVTIDDNDITGNAVGVQVSQYSHGTVVSNNLIHDNTLMMVNTADVRGDDAGAEGVALVKSSGQVVVRGNYIWGNRAPSYDYGYDGGAFSIYAASDWTITDNVTWDNRNVLETGTDIARTPCDNNTFTRNLNYGATTEDRTVGMVLRCASNTLVANNTFHGMQYFVFDISHNKGNWGGSIEGLQIVNNIVSVASGKIYGIESELPASVLIDHNIVHNAGRGYLATVMGSGTTSFETFRSWTGLEAHGLAVDPRFVDASANDYRLRADSPAVDSGRIVAGVTTGYFGAAPDRGYLERR